MAVELKTGQPIGEIRFSSDKKPDFVGSPFQVAASNNIVLVYLGDGKQLFAFRFLPEA